MSDYKAIIGYLYKSIMSEHFSCENFLISAQLGTCARTFMQKLKLMAAMKHRFKLRVLCVLTIFKQYICFPSLEHSLGILHSQVFDTKEKRWCWIISIGYKPKLLWFWNNMLHKDSWSDLYLSRSPSRNRCLNRRAPAPSSAQKHWPWIWPSPDCLRRFCMVHYS